jgi:acetyltransferase-like isoleucine patch superfamily enzyme
MVAPSPKEKKLVNVTNNGGIIHDTVKFLGSGNVILHPGAQIRHFSVIEMCGGRLEIGPNSVLGFNTMVQCTGRIDIGDTVLLGPHSVLVASFHVMSSDPLKQKKITMSKIVFEDNVWGGANVTYNHGIVVGENSVIGANSFVNKDVKPFSIVGGTPAKVIGYKGLDDEL